MANNYIKQEKKEKLKTDKAKKEAFALFKRQFIPLLIAVLLWIIVNAIIHLPALRDQVQQFFVQFTISSVIVFGKILFIPVTSPVFPNLTISGYTMQVIMECTAYNFYIFVFFLSLLSPVNWKQRLLTLLIFMLAVFIVNSLRFFTLGFAGSHYPELFHSIHDYLWNILFGFLVFLIWLWRYRVTGLPKSIV
jgi:exosortase/archaeosortase family protein